MRPLDEMIGVDVAGDVALDLFRRVVQVRDVDLNVEMARIAQDRAVLHQAEMRGREHVLSPVAVTKISPTFAASIICITRNPSIAASSARIGSTSVTITSAPRPRAREAMPRPH